MSTIALTCEPPSHGWLTLRLAIDGLTTEIDASDVPNNPIHDLANAVEQAAQGENSIVWWHLEPDGYFMRFVPVGNEIEFWLEFATNSDRSHVRAIHSSRHARDEVLMIFWRFLREFHSHQYSEPYWPTTDPGRMEMIKAKIVGSNEA